MFLDFFFSRMLRCNLRIVHYQSNRFYNFGKVIKEKRIQAVPKDEIDLSMQKIEKDIFKHDFSVIEAQIEMLFDPYKELGLGKVCKHSIVHLSGLASCVTKILRIVL